MKTMTCNQLGGPQECNHEFHAETFEEMAEKSKQHGMEMYQKNDEAHMKVMSEMREKMNDPNAMAKWMSEKKAQFDSLSDD